MRNANHLPLRLRWKLLLLLLLPMLLLLVMLLLLWHDVSLMILLHLLSYLLFSLDPGKKWSPLFLGHCL